MKIRCITRQPQALLLSLNSAISLAAIFLFTSLRLLQADPLPLEAEWDYDAMNHPLVVLDTDRYVYMARDGGRKQEYFLNLVIDDQSYPEPVTQFLFWQDRTSGQRYYFNIDAGFMEEPVDLYGRPGQPQARVIDTLVNTKILKGPNPGGMPDRYVEVLSDDVGLYLWCYEIRDASGQKLLDRAYALYSVVEDIIEIKESITRDVTWEARYAYRIRGKIDVLNGADLVIEPGTFVLGATDELSLLNVRPDSRLIADGSELFPVVFTSELPMLARRPSDWGGVVISGDAPVNHVNAEGEGGTGQYGGYNLFHDGGILRYVRIEFAGRLFSATEELNGLTFQGCGSGTIVDYVQVHQCSDDGIEFFGGTVTARHILVSGCGDDSLDWTYGYRGNLRNIVLMQLYQEADSGIEGDNHPVDFNVEPRSQPVIYNATFLGYAYDNPAAKKASPAVKIRRGSGVELRNSIFSGFGGESIMIDSEESADLLETRETQISNCLFFRNNLRVDKIQQNARLVQMLGRENSNKFGVDAGFTSVGLFKANLTPLPSSYGSDLRRSLFDIRGKSVPLPTYYLGGIEPGRPGGPWIFQPWTNFSIQ